MRYSKAILIGTGRIIYECAVELINAGVKATVYEYSDYPNSILEVLCKKNGIVFLKAGKDKLLDLLNETSEPTLVVSAYNTLIFPQETVMNKNLLIMNFHPALLPAHRGRNAEAWTIFEGNDVTGITWHIIDENIDLGLLLWTEKIFLDDTFTSYQLKMLQYKKAIECFKNNINSFIQSDCDVSSLSVISDTSNVIHFSYDKPNQGELNEMWPAKQISRFLRAMDYGRLKVMGEPFILRNGQRYIWDKYIITPNDLHFETDPTVGEYADDDIFITLKNFRKDENYVY